MNPEITIADIRAAADRIAGFARRTPLERSQWLSGRSRGVWLKLECFQETGSFKIRGAASKMTALSEAERSRGVLAVSAGNHGLAVAHCAELLGLRATIVVPKSASPAKVRAMRRYMVTVLERGANYDEAERAARALERETATTFISPYNDPAVIAGQGTIAIEMLQDQPDLDAILVPVGGGGLIAGIAIAAKAIKPDIRIIGAEPAASPAMRRSLEAGRVLEIAEQETIADGLAGNIEPGSMTFPLVQRLVDDILLVSERSIRATIWRLAYEDHLIIEGAAAVALAALEEANIRGHIGIVITGRNIELSLFYKIIGESRGAPAI
jgi:threonine dehydratase